MANHLPPLPPFSALGLDPAGPPGNTWGLFGPSDELGMLNLLTPETVVAAAREIRDGKRISLDLPLDVPAHPCFGRQRFRHEMVPRGVDRPVNDDVVEFNTQASTQWDGFRHYGNMKLKCHYMGHDQAALERTRVIGTDAWLKNGGIQGRGVLIDWASWASARNIPVEPFKSVSIPLSDVKKIISDLSIQIRQGDILILRTGVSAAYKTLSTADQHAIANRPESDFIGLEPGRDTLEWLWDCKFAAVASDCPGFERSPVAGKHHDPDHQLHQWLLAAWGMPIGEFFDLEELSAYCEEKGRWEFFFSSVPLKVPGGVASPPNAVAIF
ncbi:putative cyclase [Saccharata proteae CBS 121410]|uniref:Putative cyclase n=1 Tax=Saccharata proteae CBS 121410 TaxID=1314787 RepID=A0A6A5YBD8_9PEZI|nr:putative cyclase [Saccharata proteae CBS 121410]